MPPSIRPLLAAVALLAAAAPAAAEVAFFVNDVPGFTAATTGQPLLGVEDWSSAGNAALQAIDAPLAPGVANGPFPQGTNPGTGMTVVPNTNGANGQTLAPGLELFFAPAGFTGASGNVQPTNQVSVNLNTDAFHMAFADVAGEPAAAVSFSPMFYRTNGAANAGTITVTVYDGANALVGTASIPNVVDTQETSFLGIVGAPGEIRRVNVWAGGTAAPGADNIHVFAPEPAAGAGAAVAALLLAAGRRRAQSNSA